MSKKMLIDASQPEETRVVVVNGTRVEELDFESQNKRQLRGNVYLARVTRVEPSLQAAFVEFGGNRHGFLAFGEIHPDYYDLPHEDRMALIAAEEAENRADDAKDDEEEAREKPKGKSSRGNRRRRGRSRRKGSDAANKDAPAPVEDTEDEGEDPLRPAATSYGMAGRRKEVELPPVKPHVAKTKPDAPKKAAAKAASAKKPAKITAPSAPEITPEDDEDTVDPTRAAATSWNVSQKLVFSNFDIEKDPTSPAADNFKHADSLKVAEYNPSIIPEDDEDEDESNSNIETEALDAEILEDAADEDDQEVAEEQAQMDRKRKQRISRRRYKIQEVIKRGQIMLVQAVKEERGNKGAALTTYLSLAGRYCVLMPNTPRGGGISRKIANSSDRKRLKSIMSNLEVPKGMGVIVRTAGAKQSSEEITRDFEYLAKLWETIRSTTLASFAPALIHQEGDLVKRSLRDMFNKDVSEILVQGDGAYDDAHSFIDMLMPAQLDKVKKYEDDIPLFLRYQVEQQIEASLEPVAQLKSGGYLVIHPTEALVSVDVNSGRSTKERNVERTALKTNLEAAEEVARQMRLRDLAGLVVIDFIDMDESRNNRAVENKMKECLARDRARVQMGRISQFGLMEISRQRRRRSLLEGSSASCEHCAGVGRKRSVESSALKAIRAVEEEGIRGRAERIRLKVSPNVALYLFNEKRDMLQNVDTRFEMFTELVSDDTLHRPHYEIETVEERAEKRPDPLDAIKKAAQAENNRRSQQRNKNRDSAPEAEKDEAEQSGEEGSKRKRRRRRGGKRNNDSGAQTAEAQSNNEVAAEQKAEVSVNPETGEEQPRKRRRRRGRRGGRGKRAENQTESAEASQQDSGAETSQAEAPNEAVPKTASKSSDAEGSKQAQEQDAKPKRKRSRKSAPSKSSADKQTDEVEAKADATPKPKRRRTRSKAPSSAKADAAPSLVKSDAPSEKAKDAASKPKRVRKKAPAPKKEVAPQGASDGETAPKKKRAKPKAKAEIEASAAEKPKRVRAKAPAPKKETAKADAPKAKPTPSPKPVETSAKQAPISSDSKADKKSKSGGWWGKRNPFK